jgi:hypothetical protein
MKTLVSFILGLLMLTSCNSQKAVAEKESVTTKEMTKQKKLPVLEYEALSRGYYRKITIENQQVTVIAARNVKPVIFSISDEDWKELVNLYITVDKEGLADLESPTQKRFYDGAPIANFRVIEGDTIYESGAFDGGIPPQAIEKIVNKIIEIADKNLKSTK